MRIRIFANPKKVHYNLTDQQAAAAEGVCIPQTQRVLTTRGVPCEEGERDEREKWLPKKGNADSPSLDHSTHPCSH